MDVRFWAVSFMLTIAVSLTLFASSLPSVGSVAPDFTLNSQDGKAVSLKDYRGSWSAPEARPR